MGKSKAIKQQKPLFIKITLQIKINKNNYKQHYTHVKIIFTTKNPKQLSFVQFCIKYTKKQHSQPEFTS